MTSEVFYGANVGTRVTKGWWGINDSCGPQLQHQIHRLWYGSKTLTIPRRQENAFSKWKQSWHWFLMSTNSLWASCSFTRGLTTQWLGLETDWNPFFTQFFGFKFFVLHSNKCMYNFFNNFSFSIILTECFLHILWRWILLADRDTNKIFIKTMMVWCEGDSALSVSSKTQLPSLKRQLKCLDLKASQGQKYLKCCCFSVLWLYLKTK